MINLKAEFEKTVCEVIGANERDRRCGCECGHSFRRLPPTRYIDVAEEIALRFLTRLEEAKREQAEEVIKAVDNMMEVFCAEELNHLEATAACERNENLPTYLQLERPLQALETKKRVFRDHWKAVKNFLTPKSHERL